MFFEKYREKQDGAIRFFDLHSPSVKVATVLIFLACILIIICALFPAVWVCLAGFKSIREFRQNPTILPPAYDFSVFRDSWNELGFGQYYLNSLISVVGCTVCGVFFNGLLAYGISILKPKGYQVINGLVLWSMLIPATTSIVSLFVNITRIGLSGTFIPLWLCMGANAFFVILFKQYFDGFPRSLLEAARLDGCGSFRVFWQIVLPLSMPIVMVVCIFAVTAAWSDFLLPYLLLSNTGNDTVMVRLFQFRTGKSNDIDLIRAIVFSIIPPVILFTVFQKQITQSVVTAGIKG